MPVLVRGRNTLTYYVPVSTKNRLAELPSTINNRLLNWLVAEATTDDQLRRFPYERARWAALPGCVAESPVVEADVDRSVGRSAFRGARLYEVCGERLSAAYTTDGCPLGCQSASAVFARGRGSSRLAAASSVYAHRVTRAFRPAIS